MSRAIQRLVFFHASAVCYLYWLRKPAIVPSEEIESIRHWMGEVNHASIRVESIPIGSRACLGLGPLMGRLGKVTEHRGGQVTIVLDQLGIQVRVKAQQTSLITA